MIGPRCARSAVLVTALLIAACERAPEQAATPAAPAAVAAAPATPPPAPPKGERYIGILDGELPFDMLLDVEADGSVSGGYAYRSKPEQKLVLRGSVGKGGAIRMTEAAATTTTATTTTTTATTATTTAPAPAETTGVFALKPAAGGQVTFDGYVGTWTRANGSGGRSVTLLHDVPASHFRVGANDVVVLADVHDMGKVASFSLPVILGLSPAATAAIDARMGQRALRGHAAWRERE
jgi:hypothetical protein